MGHPFYRLVKGEPPAAVAEPPKDADELIVDGDDMRNLLELVA
jgi:hypothetical protein